MGGSSILTNQAGDHPIWLIDLRESRRIRSNAECLLFHTRQKSKFWTILSVRKPDGSFIHLRHFVWELRWETKILRWRGDTPTEVSIATELTADGKIFDGPPVELGKSGVALDGHATPANETVNDALLAVRRRDSKSTSGFQENDDWFANAPRSFFEPP